MSYKLKTLVVFDTNSLRTIEEGEVAYSFFGFGRPFQVIEEFILEKSLSEDIHLAIPSLAIEELKDQKNRQYLNDVVKYNEITKRLSGLPSFEKIPLPNPEFDCKTYVQEKANEYLASKEIKILEIKEELANTVLQSMMKRVMRDEKKKKPFASSGKYYKDAGFKDNIVWESLIHYEGISNFDKVIFVTKDGDYANCDKEFEEKWNKHFIIEKDENNVLAEIQRDYQLYIKERVIYDSAQTEYFRDYLFDGLKTKTEICFEAANFKIENFEILDTCNNVERMPPDEDLEENLIIHSTINIFFTEKGEKNKQIVTAETTLADDETKEIIETVYDLDLI